MTGVELKVTLDQCVIPSICLFSSYIHSLIILLQGLSNFQNGQAFIGGFSNFAQTFVFAFYSYGGVELVSLAAGEAARPHKAVPRAVRATFVRIVIFYVLTILVIGLNINWNDPTLLNASWSNVFSDSTYIPAFS